MGEINHFSHVKHSLKLIENWETIVDDHGEKKGEVRCEGCREPISILGGSVYGCVECGYFLHKTCTELAPTINHHFHPFHPLTINHQKYSGWGCDVCGDRDILPGFSYRCDDCDFDSCLKCAAAIAPKDATLIKLKHEGHSQHTLTLQSRSASFLCDACHTEDRDFFYQCNDCDFWIHKNCTTLAPTIELPHHHHPLVLVYSLPDNFYKFRFYCEFCNKVIIRNDWLYHCANCRYFSHIKCALNAQLRPTPRDDSSTSVDEEHVKDLLHFPMPSAFTDPLKQLHSGKVVHDDGETNEINHWSHDHPLILNVEPQGNSIPLSKDGCSFTLHKYCAQLPRTLNHQLHPQHLVCLVKTGWYECTGCLAYGNTFVYRCETFEFRICINCAFLPNTIKHISHKHPLVQLINSNHTCNACYKWSNYGISYACKACDFQLDMHCAMRMPQSLAHRYCKGHDDVLLTYPPVENHPEDFYCDICEEEMHPKRPLYHCQNHKNSFHLKCLSRPDWFANIWRTPHGHHNHVLSQTSINICSKKENAKRKDNLEVYTSDYTAQVLVGYCTVYIFMQTFMIPGTVFMSLLAGSLFGVLRGVALVVFAATAGASSCYFLSKLIGRPLISSMWPDKLVFFQDQVAKRQDGLLNYMLFLRLTPTFPNMFINVASPIVNVPYHTFLLGTSIGIIPAAYVTVKAGITLGELQSVKDLYDIHSIGTLFLIGIASVTPTLISKKKTS
ncbi:C1-like protein [Artemisia annua]|uniref:C1-like protein n=1 Tax=Artemisia annua TaxID=35608 RepID=A0A2U1LPY7_ARTAN|nr:C1-like protein [Artemisia annua]